MHVLRVVLTALLAPPVFLGSALCAGAAVAAHFGRRSLEWDLLAHFAPVWLAGAALGFLGGFLFRSYARALILGMGAVGVAASLALMASEYARDTGPKASPDAPDQLKVLQLNVWVRNENAEGLLDWAAGQDADIVILEEAFPELRRRVRERGEWRITCPECEVMILSRREPVARGVPKGVAPAGGPITRATFRDQRGEFSVVGVHHNWPTDIAEQQAQERRLAQVLALTPGDRTIVAGDFNSAPWSFSRRRWDAEFGLIRRDRALFSWPAVQYKRLRGLGLFPFLPIDHVYAGPGWATVKVERGPRLGSDHYPVIMTLAPVSQR